VNWLIGEWMLDTRFAILDSAYGGQVRQKYGGFVEFVAVMWYNINYGEIKEGNSRGEAQEEKGMVGK
jgi:hypothetical protein